MIKLQWREQANRYAQNGMVDERPDHSSPPSHDRFADIDEMHTRHGEPSGMRTIRTRTLERTTVTYDPTPSAAPPVTVTAIETLTLTQQQTITSRVPPFALNAPLLARDAYPNDAFGGEVLGAALGAAIFAVGLARLWHVLRP